MNTRTILRHSVTLLAAASLGVAAAEKEKAQEPARPGAKEAEKAAEPRVKRLPNGDVVVGLDEETQKKMGLVLAHLTATNMTAEARAFGRVLEPAPLITLVNDFVLAETALKLSQADLERAQKSREVDLATAQAAATASKQELERTKSLKDRDNASLRALQAAEAAARRDELQVQSQQIAAARAVQTAEAAVRRDQLASESLHLRAMLAWGKSVLDQPDLPGLVHRLAGQESALVRLELPAGGHLKDAPLGARLVALGGEAGPVEAEILGPAPAVDPQTQGQAWFFLVKESGGKLPVNAAVTGHLKLPGGPVAGVIVPRSAIIRAEGGAWIYVETGEEKFTRKAVALDHATDAGWFVTGGFTEQDEVVTTGAQVLWSEEIKPAGKGD